MFTKKVWLGVLAVLLAQTGLLRAQSGSPYAPTTVSPQVPPPAGSTPSPPAATLPPPRNAGSSSQSPAPMPPPPPPPPESVATIEVEPCPERFDPLVGWAVAPPGSLRQRFWVSADYLLWWTKSDKLPPLVTLGSPSDSIPGALGQSGTQTIFGGDSPNNGVHSGGRFNVGYWLTREQTLGLEGSFFFLGIGQDHFDYSSPGVPLLARPFFNVNTNREDASPVAIPNQQSGSISASVRSFLWGADANVRTLALRGAWYQVALLGGFRYLELHDGLHMTEQDQIFPAVSSDPTVWVTATDRLHTDNNFYGGQLGTDMVFWKGRLYVDVLGKVALGTTNEYARINGSSSVTTSSGASNTFGFGQLALPTNIGDYSRNVFSVVPEAGFNLGYVLTPHLRMSVGYTFLYWSSVFRVGDQIDRAANPSQVPAILGTGVLSGPARPTFTMRDTDFWAQGLNFNVEFRY
jgi:hypothetical protein